MMPGDTLQEACLQVEWDIITLSDIVDMYLTMRLDGTIFRAGTMILIREGF